MMGEARRRKLAGTYPTDRQKAGPDAMQSEGQDIYTLGIYTVAEIVALSARVAAGDTTANSDMIVAGGIFKDFFARYGTPQEAPCWCCHRPVVRSVRRVCAVVTFTAAVDQPTNVTGGVVCSECFTTVEELRAQIEADWRQWDPSLRRVDTSTSGHA